MLISQADSNIFVSAFYHGTNSGAKVFKGLERMNHLVGICDIQHQEVFSAFSQAHKKQHRNAVDFSSTLYLLNDAQSKYLEFYNSPRVAKLSSNFFFDVNTLTTEDKV
ncbi:MAG: hypothetical protein ACRCXZ_01350 [Patescibacteria group bacterium]